MSDPDPTEGVERHVLVIEDDPTLAEVVERYLHRAGHRVEVCGDGREGLERALHGGHDLVVLDVLLPGMDGFEVCRSLRRRSPVPVVMLTARAEEDDRVLGLELGADDYVTKPFSPRELTARVAAVLRRTSGPVEHVDVAPLAAGRIRVDTLAREVVLGDEPVHLTTKEYELLVHLMSHPRRAFRREELFESVWGWSYGDASTVTVHVRRLRVKLEDDPGAPRHLVTVAGGYRFEP